MLEHMQKAHEAHHQQMRAAEEELKARHAANVAELEHRMKVIDGQRVALEQKRGRKPTGRSPRRQWHTQPERGRSPRRRSPIQTTRAPGAEPAASPCR